MDTVKIKKTEDILSDLKEMNSSFVMISFKNGITKDDVEHAQEHFKDTGKKIYHGTLNRGKDNEFTYINIEQVIFPFKNFQNVYSKNRDNFRKQFKDLIEKIKDLDMDESYIKFCLDVNDREDQKYFIEQIIREEFPINVIQENDHISFVIKRKYVSPDITYGVFLNE